MKSILAAVMTRIAGVPVRQRMIAVVAAALAVSGLAALVLRQTGLAMAALMMLQVLAIAVGIITFRRLLWHLHSSINAVSQAAPAETGGKKAALHKFGAVRYYAKSNAGKQTELSRQLVLHRSVDGRDILAYQATRGELDYKGMVSFIENFRSSERRGKARVAARNFKCEPLLALARTVYRQEVRVSDRIDALGLFDLVSTVFGRKALDVADWECVVSALVRERRGSEALRKMDESGLNPRNSPNYHLLRANIFNPFAPGLDGDLGTWLDCINHSYVEADLANLEVADGEGSAFSRLSAQSRETVDGPLVSVIMPTYKAGQGIDGAIQSVLAQTWTNLELIIVDDGSPTEKRGALSRWEGRDSRIKIIRCAVNRGAYTARNIGLQAARGEFVTCHDADDWSHPQKLEMQARDLARYPGRIANMTNIIRVGADLGVDHRHPGRTLRHPGLSTLMFRRQEVVKRIGYWDSVRKMADAEFVNRIRLVFQQDVPLVCDAPLMLALQDTNSLSGSDMLRGYMDPERQIYRARYREWHERIESGDASAYVPLNASPRPFPAPDSFLPARTESRAFDVIFVSELGFTGGNVHSLVHEMKICLDAGLRVGLIRMHNLLFTHLATREPIPSLSEIVESGQVTEIALTTHATADLVIVRWPACFQYTTNVVPAVKTGRVVIVANHPPYEKHQDRHSYEMTTVSRNVACTFGVEPEWAPQSATIRRMLDPQLPRRALLDVDWIAVLAQEPSRVRKRVSPVSDRPVIGRHSRDHHLKWPEKRSTLLEVYPADESVKVRVLGGVDNVVAAGALKAQDLVHWDVLAFNAVPPMEFLQSIDFFVYYHHRDWVEAFGRVIMEAMFAGAVVILPPSFEAVFGDAAVYAEPRDVRSRIQELYADWPRFVAQSERGKAYAYTHCTPSAYLRRLARLGVGSLRSSLREEFA